MAEIRIKKYKKREPLFTDCSIINVVSVLVL